LSDYLGELAAASASLAQGEEGVDGKHGGDPFLEVPDAHRFPEQVARFAEAKQGLLEAAGGLDDRKLRTLADQWEEKLSSLGDDAQLANVDLQNVLQKQQQTLQMMSNISKMLYDTAQSVIRKMGG
jgi:hypothetical protein